MDNSIYLHEYSRSSNGRKHQLFIRPELGLFYDVSPKGRIVLKANYGFNLHGDVLTLDYKRIRYQGEFYQTKHRYSGDFISTLLANEIKFKA
ncbi:hypothetical protein MM236_12405 [Belliella sp. DSM 107340]|uniref:Uncharacterized protein n=1 Tax=Belliella calami TaxID=2923436 RepID=A0ABS9UQA6_9BACT|nr:hypothetical protein [Belliella calami]MCH7398797.1 hypothetical protein [Belliella calami]